MDPAVGAGAGLEVGPERQDLAGSTVIAGRRVSVATAPRSSASRHFGLQRVEAALPGAAQGRSPLVHGVQSGGLEGVEPPCAVGPHPGEAVVAQDAEVLRDRRLADTEVWADDLHDLTGGCLPGREQFEDAAAHRVAEDVEGVQASGAAPV